jgi:hypothetical protein
MPLDVRDELIIFAVAMLRAHGASMNGDAVEFMAYQHGQALLYAEKLLRSADANERMIGADLKQILTGT